MRLVRLFTPALSLVFSTAILVYGQGLPGDGLKAEIVGVKIPDNRRSVVTFRVNDSKGKPLNIEDLDPDSVRFTIAAVEVGKTWRERLS